MINSYTSHLIHKTMGISGFIRRIEWRRMLEWLAPKEGERILDMSLMGGELSLKIAERGCEVSGIDVSEGGIEHAKRLAEREEIIYQVGVAKDRSDYYGR